MEKIYIRAIESSSFGNTIVLYDGFTHLFLDFGTQPKNIETYFTKYNVKHNEVAGALITHAHTDHIRSIGKSISKDIDFYASKQTIDFIKSTNDVNQTNLIEVPLISKHYLKIKNSNWSFKTFKTQHNILGSIGFVIKNKNKKILYLTDTEPIRNKLFKKLDAYIVESNYGTSTLSSKAQTDKHIDCKINHMNIHDTEAFLREYYSKKTKIFIFSHLSKNGLKNKELADELMTVFKNENKNVYYINPFDILKFVQSF